MFMNNIYIIYTVYIYCGYLLLYVKEIFIISSDNIRTKTCYVPMVKLNKNHNENFLAFVSTRARSGSRPTNSGLFIYM